MRAPPCQRPDVSSWAQQGFARCFKGLSSPTLPVTAVGRRANTFPMTCRHQQLPPPWVYTVDQAAHVLAISRRQTERLLASGALASVTIGSRRLVPINAVELFFRELILAQLAKLPPEPASTGTN